MVKIWPLVGLASIRTLGGGAFRIWSLSRLIDSNGSGVVSDSYLNHYLELLGVHETCIQRWKASALNLCIMRKVVRQKSGQVFYTLKGLARVAIAFGCHQIGSPVAIPTKLFVQSGWRAWVWAAFLCTLDGRPISRAAMRQLTGVPEQTQRDYERTVGVAVIENYAVSNLSGDHISGFREFERPYAFVFKDANTSGYFVAYQLPNSYHPPSTIMHLPKGRSRKAQKAVNAVLYSVEQDQSRTVKLYYMNHKGANSGIRRISQIDEINIPMEVYVHRQSGSAKTWEVIE